MAKARSSTKSKTKAELLQEAVAEAVGAGKELHLESVDFSDPNRPKTCLEVDFPILPVNHVAIIEGNAGKPIYQMSKWWARRRSSVFRAMLIAAATKAPEDPAEAAKLVWDSYYGNHQSNSAFQELKVADIFMGGGTTVVEGSRLGMQMYGNDLNPVAWLVVKNELAKIDSSEVNSLLAYIEAEVKPQIMPFYACDCPRGHKGKWMHKQSGKVMAVGFDPVSLSESQRAEYKYNGPEVIYTFWSKHGPCSATGCSHRTPIMSSPVIAVKTLTVKALKDIECPNCHKAFDVESSEVRSAPGSLFVVSPEESPFAIRNSDGTVHCPHCKYHMQKALGGVAKNKAVELTVLVHPDWLRGAPGKNSKGVAYGGSVQDDPESTAAWHQVRNAAAKLIEVRGALPDTIIVPDTQEEFYTDKRSGTIPKQAQFQCKEATCGLAQEIVISVSKTKKSGPVSACAIQGFCPSCKEAGYPYDGRFFASPDLSSYDAAHNEWDRLRDSELNGFWPRGTIPLGHMTPVQNDLPAHGYPDWWCLFNDRQLLIHARLLKSIVEAPGFTWEAKEAVLGGFQQYLRNQNMFCFWNPQRDTLEPMFSNNNYHPKTVMIENCVFAKLGRGNWSSCVEGIVEGLEWCRHPWEIVAAEDIDEAVTKTVGQITSRSVKVAPGDPLTGTPTLSCGSSSNLSNFASESYDIVATDPPFGGLLHYSELSDFFFAWLRLPFRDKYPELFGPEQTPKALEAVSNKTRHPEDHEAFYQKILTQCWREALRILKPSGILTFTFHHSEDEPWVAVLESLFEAGFYLEATYPIRSDETKGDGQFGSKQIEFDIIHVCRKRMEDPKEISWARLRRQILQDVKQLQEIIEHHEEAGLAEADLQVIRRGKALEYYSRHYGKIYIEKGREEKFTVKDALVGINQLLDDERDTSIDRPPELAEPYTRQFLRLFAGKASLDRDQIQKYLRGTGVSPSEFIDRTWCTEKKKIFTIADPLAWAQDWKGKSRRTMARDFDQAYFLIGASYEDSGIKVSDTLSSESFVPHPALGELLTWFVKHSPTEEMRAAAKRAQQLYSAWQAKNTKVVVSQRTLFDLEE